MNVAAPQADGPPPLAALRILAPLLLVAAGVAVYSNSFGGVFVHDDWTIVLDNPKIQKLWPPWEAIYGYPDPQSPDRPVGAYTLAISYALSGYQPWGYHLVNLLIHLLTGLTLYGLMRRTLKLESLRPRLGEHAEGLALAVALVWIVHPVCVVCVTYTIQRVQALMSLFYLLTLYTALRGFMSSRPWRWYAASGIACLLGMGCKQDMATAPLGVFVFDAVLVSWGWRLAWRKHKALYAVLALTWLPLAVLVARGRMQGVVGQVLEQKWSHGQYLLNQFDAHLLYLKLSIFPFPTSFQHYRDVCDTPAEVLVPMAPIALAGGFTLWGLWERRAWSVPAALFFLVLAPSSSFLALPALAEERRMYLPVAAPVAILVVGASTLILNRGVRGRTLALWGLVLIGAWAGALGALTLRRNTLFESGRTLWEDVQRNYPRAPLAYNELGFHLDRRGHAEQAEEQFRKCLAVEPGHPLGSLNLASHLLKRGEFHEALPLLEAAQNDPRIRHYPDFYLGYGGALLQVGRMEDAETWLQRGLDLVPSDARLWINLGMVHEARQASEAAVKAYRQAMVIDPNWHETYLRVGAALAGQGKLEEALAYLEKAYRLRPDDPAAARAFAHGRGLLLMRQADGHVKRGWEASLAGRMEEGLQEIYYALRLLPEHPQARHYAKVLREKANERFQALDAEEDSTAALFLLALAFATEGNYEEAASIGRLAAASAEEQKRPEQAESILGRVRAFERGEAFPPPAEVRP
ncbi:MAG: tetratricopeptide repeat protein [Planctomycetes bacterium]|nr:tetratricopeptide repeat protein [Planctomycetota bacterium]